MKHGNVFDLGRMSDGLICQSEVSTPQNDRSSFDLILDCNLCQVRITALWEHCTRCEYANELGIIQIWLMILSFLP